MKAYMGVTDLDWYRQLSARGLEHDEVNFWFPSPNQRFAALDPGEPFIFKTHVSRTDARLSNRIVGVGLFSGYARLQISEAWNWFGLENGVRSQDELRQRIERYRKTPIGRFDDPQIGAVLLNRVVFFPADHTLPAPDDFATNIVRGRGYLTNELDASHSALEALVRHQIPGLRVDVPDSLRPATQGEAVLTVPRIGQQAFKAVIAENFHHHCAITGDKVRPVLQAAHIRPVQAGGEHRRDNGLLLRSDVHTLFDRGYLGVDDNYRLRVSPAIREEFGNGDWFYAHAGTEIGLPDRRADRPSREYLAWHNDEVFRSTT